MQLASFLETIHNHNSYLVEEECDRLKELP